MSAFELATLVLFGLTAIRIIRIEAHLYRLAKTFGQYMLKAHPEEAEEIRRTDPALVRMMEDER